MTLPEFLDVVEAVREREQAQGTVLMQLLSAMTSRR